MRNAMMLFEESDDDRLGDEIYEKLT